MHDGLQFIAQSSMGVWAPLSLDPTAEEFWTNKSASRFTDRSGRGVTAHGKTERHSHATVTAPENTESAGASHATTTSAVFRHALQLCMLQRANTTSSRPRPHSYLISDCDYRKKPFAPLPSKYADAVGIKTPDSIAVFASRCLGGSYSEALLWLWAILRCTMPQLLFQDRGDMKRTSVGLLARYLVDLRRTLDAKTSLRLLTQKQISEVATTSKCRPLELLSLIHI